MYEKSECGTRGGFTECTSYNEARYSDYDDYDDYDDYYLNIDDNNEINEELDDDIYWMENALRNKDIK